MPTYDCYILLLSWSRKVMLSQRSHHSCFPLSSVWEKRVPVGQNSEKEEWERKKLQRFLPQSSATGASILDFLSRFWCLCHHDHHHWIIYEWDCLCDSGKRKKKKALPPMHSTSGGLPVPSCWPERQSFSKDFGSPCPTAQFCNVTLWLKIKVKKIWGKAFKSSPIIVYSSPFTSSVYLLVVIFQNPHLVAFCFLSRSFSCNQREQQPLVDLLLLDQQWNSNNLASWW